MPNVCRFCVRWTNSTREINDVVSLDDLNQLFGIEIERHPEFPHHACGKCSIQIQHSFRFFVQLIDTEQFLHQLHATGQLAGLLAKQQDIGKPLVGCNSSAMEDDAIDSMKKYYLTDTIHDHEDIRSIDNEPLTDVDEEEEPGTSHVFKDFEVLPHGTESEKLVGIEIEAVEELEIVSAPLEKELPEATLDDLLPLGNIFESSDDENDEFDPEEIESAKKNNSSDRQSMDETASADETSQPMMEEPRESLLKPSNIHYLKEKDERIPNKCYICDKVFSQAATLEAHLVEHEDHLPYWCQQCSTSKRMIHIRTIVALNNHLETHTYKFVCNQCPLRFRRYTSWYEHNSNMHSNVRSCTCSFCGMHFEEYRKYLKHVAAHRNKQSERYKCATCEKVFQTKTLLKRHELIHSQETPFKCTYCGRGFRHEWNMKLHLRRHARQTGLYECEQCGVQYPDFVDWRRHMKEHFPLDKRYWEVDDIVPESLRDATAYPLGCVEPGCTYVAASLQLMWGHYRAHFKAFQCDFCQQKFSCASNLRIHIDVVHRGVRPYECEQCGKRFAYRHKLREHLNSHDGVRSLQCKYCAKTFRHSSNLTVHERVHTGARPYRCDLCEARFRTSSALVKHRGQQDQTTGERAASKSCVRQQLKRQQQKNVQT